VNVQPQPLSEKEKIDSSSLNLSHAVMLSVGIFCEVQLLVTHHTNGEKYLRNNLFICLYLNVLKFQPLIVVNAKSCNGDFAFLFGHFLTLVITYTEPGNS
jgi:hypothetical protein